MTPDAGLKSTPSTSKPSEKDAQPHDDDDAIFQSHLQYGVLIWSSTFKSYLRKLIVLQNKALRIIGGAKWNERASPYYLKFKILKQSVMFKFESAVFTFNFNKQ